MRMIAKIGWNETESTRREGPLSRAIKRSHSLDSWIWWVERYVAFECAGDESGCEKGEEVRSKRQGKHQGSNEVALDAELNERESPKSCCVRWPRVLFSVTASHEGKSDT
jgi:hypothetical protein